MREGGTSLITHQQPHDTHNFLPTTPRTSLSAPLSQALIILIAKMSSAALNKLLRSPQGPSSVLAACPVDWP